MLTALDIELRAEIAGLHAERSVIDNSTWVFIQNPTEYDKLVARSDELTERIRKCEAMLDEIRGLD